LCRDGEVIGSGGGREVGCRHRGAHDEVGTNIDALYSLYPEKNAILCSILALNLDIGLRFFWTEGAAPCALCDLTTRIAYGPVLQHSPTSTTPSSRSSHRRDIDHARQLFNEIPPRQAAHQTSTRPRRPRPHRARTRWHCSFSNSQPNRGKENCLDTHCPRRWNTVPNPFPNFPMPSMF
jgi:hypothetical protein